MSRLPDPNLPDSYDKASLASVLRGIINQVNSTSEGAGAGRYQAQSVAPSATAVNLATADITWNSNPTEVGSVISGLAANYITLGWIATSPGTGASATQKEIRVLTGGGAGISSLLVSPLSVLVGAATVSVSVQASAGTLAYTDSQAFTGTCTAALTAATTTNTTQLANTAFVQQELTASNRVAHAWANFDIAASIAASVGISAVTDTSAALKTIAFTRAFSNAFYVPTMLQRNAVPAGFNANCVMDTDGSTTTSALLYNGGSETSTDGYCVSFFGAQ